MKKIITFSFLSLLVILLASLNNGQDIVKVCSVNTPVEALKSAGPPPYYAGEPLGFGNCTASGCHDGITGTPNIGNATVKLDLGLAESGYMPGQKYTVTISVSKTGMRRAGFQIIALKDNDNSISPGRVSLTD